MAKKTPQKLVFIDTNILLDFYRVAGRESELSILDHIDDNHERIITTAQVEMEFKKNRPSVILQAHKGLKTPDWSSINLPAFLNESKQSSGIDTGRKGIEQQLKTLRSRIKNALGTPSRYDPVYKVAQRLFKADGAIHLTRSKPERRVIRRKAFRRFMLGYPPRKATDTSIGDAVNWEWIVECACKTGQNVVIVSRDSDYGVSFDSAAILNDWLLHEFKERVGRRRTVELTDRLTEGLKMASIKVKKAEEKTEETLIQQLRPTQSPSRPLAIGRSRLVASANLNRFIESIVASGGLLGPVTGSLDDESAAS